MGVTVGDTTCNVNGVLYLLPFVFHYFISKTKKYSPCMVRGSTLLKPLFVKVYFLT